MLDLHDDLAEGGKLIGTMLEAAQPEPPEQPTPVSHWFAALARRDRSILAWERFFCGGKLEPDFIRKVQAALAQRGYDPGPVDGEARPEFYAALRKFQMAAGLGQGQLTISTAKALGVW